MHWTGWIVVILTVLNGGYMAFDGIRALTTGDYLTPQSGEYAGQLGPWAKLVKAIGIEPRSSVMKSIFVVLGILGIAAAVCFALKISWAWWAVLSVSILGLWYLPFGTIIGLIIILLLFLSPLRTDFLVNG